jgi:hypothetical protein
MIEVVVAPSLGDRVRVRATGAEGVVVEIFARHASADVDLGDGITAEMGWDEIEVIGHDDSPRDGDP